MFETPEFKALSAADRIWAKGLTREIAGNALIECASENNTVRTAYIIGTFYSTKYDDDKGLKAHAVRTAIGEAIRKDAPDSLELLLKSFGPPWLTENSWSCSHYIFPLFSCAAEMKSATAFETLIAWQAEKFGGNGCSVVDVANLAAHYDPEGLLPSALDYAESIKRKSAALNGVLDIAAENDDRKKLDLMLARGADIHHDKGAVLYAAAKADRQDMVDYLLSKGAAADLTAYGSEIIEKLRENSAPASAVLYMEGLYEKTIVRQNNVKQEEKRFSLVGPDILAETLPLPSGGTLTLMFNFATRQQIVTTQESSGAALQVVSFSAIEDPEAIERAAQKFIELGGDPKKTETPKIRNGSHL